LHFSFLSNHNNHFDRKTAGCLIETFGENSDQVV
jgi:hypothetical protein